MDSDEQLMLRIQNRDEKAFSDLVHRHTDRFFRLAYRMVSNTQDAEDIVQHAFLKLWQKPKAFKTDRNARFTTWFYRVVVHQSIDLKRSQKNKPALHGDFSFVEGSDRPEEALVQKDMQQAIDLAVMALPDKQKVALNLCFYEGVSNKEAAEIMGINLKALESLLMRAKSGVKDDLKRKDII